MRITVKKYENSLKHEWDNFVDISNNGTIFHKRRFLSYHIGRKFIDHSLLFYKNNYLISIFTASEIKVEKKLILHSHPGASYGGFIFNNYSFELVENVIECFEEYLRCNLFDETILVQPPAIYGSRYDETIEYSLNWNKFITAELYISSAIDLKGNPLARIHSRKKRYKRKSLDKSLKLEWNTDYDEFYPILLENKNKHNVKPTHSLEELKKLHKLFPKKMKLLMLYRKGSPIGGTLIIIANKNTAIVFYNMIDYQYSNDNPAIHLLAESITWAKSKNFKWLDLGVSQLPLDENPLAPHKSLIQFKEQFGATAFLRRAYRKKIN